MQGMGRGGGGAKRKLKRARLQGNEKADIVDSLLGMFLAHGVVVEFPWQITQAVGELLEQRSAHVAAPSHQIGAGGSNPQLSKAHLPKALVASGASSAPRTNRSLQLEPTPEDDELYGPPPEPIDPWAEVAEAMSLSSDEEEYDEGGFESYEEASSGHMSEAEMIAAFKAGQERMAERVATQGVQYKHGMQGPASGQRIAPHPRTGAAPTTAPGTPPKGIAMVPPPQEGERRGKNGLTPSQARALLSQATGREVRPPGANPVMKPSV